MNGTAQEVPSTIEAVYGLCGPESEDHYFKIWAFFLGDAPVNDAISPPTPFPFVQEDFRTWPIGIAVDKLRIWVFSNFFIACVTHTAVKQHLEKKTSSLDWTIYRIPKEVLGYDPSEYISRGLVDLAACDDGTLTAVFEDKGGLGRIYTATPRFEGKELIIERTVVGDRGNETKIHGWVREPSNTIVAKRVHKLPIFCWPTIEALEKVLQPKA